MKETKMKNRNDESYDNLYNELSKPRQEVVDMCKNSNPKFTKSHIREVILELHSRQAGEDLVKFGLTLEKKFAK